MAAFRGMHVLPAKQSYAWLPRKCDCRTDGQTDRCRTKWSLCAVRLRRQHSYRDRNHRHKNHSGQSQVPTPESLLGKSTLLSNSSLYVLQIYDAWLDLPIPEGSGGKYLPEVPQSPDARLSWAIVVQGFICMISKVKMQVKIQRDWNFMTLTFALTFCMRTRTPGV